MPRNRDHCTFCRDCSILGAQYSFCRRPESPPFRPGRRDSHRVTILPMQCVQYVNGRVQIKLYLQKHPCFKRARIQSSFFLGTQTTSPGLPHNEMGPCHQLVASVNVSDRATPRSGQHTPPGEFSMLSLPTRWKGRTLRPRGMTEPQEPPNQAYGPMLECLFSQK